MPPRRRGVGKAAAQVASIKPGAPKVGKKAPPKARAKGTGAHKMPPPLPPGEILQDFHKRKWTLGTSVGKGGFGEIYLAAPQGTKLSPSTAEHVIKIVSSRMARTSILKLAQLSKYSFSWTTGASCQWTPFYGTVLLYTNSKTRKK